MTVTQGGHFHTKKTGWVGVGDSGSGGGDFILKLPLQLKMKRPDMESVLAEAFICSCKNKKWKQRTCCPGRPWS